MKRTLDPQVLALLDTVHKALDPDETLFLVGGAVRDWLLRRPLHDLDFVMPVSPIPLARRLANRLQAGFYMLDDDRHTARVVHHLPGVGQFPLDFVRFCGGSLTEDLRLRDFTLNAMAVSVRDLSTLIDPLQGKEDLEQRVLRACGMDVLKTDPVRVLRGIRQSLQFDLTITNDTRRLMREAAPLLPKTSSERQRDELFKILSGPDPDVGLRMCQDFGVFATIAPELEDQLTIPASPPHVYPLWTHTLKTVQALEVLIACFQNQLQPPENLLGPLAAVREAFAPYEQQLGQYFAAEITPGRSKRSLALLGALLHDLGKPETMHLGEDERLHFYNHDAVGADLVRQVAKRLQLSNAEVDWIFLLVRYHMRLLPLVNADEPPTSRAIYRFFRKAGEVGVAIAVLSLADTWATFGLSLTAEKWRQSLAVSRAVFSAWWAKDQPLVAPELLLNGHDIQAIFGLKPGKLIGRLLAQLAEAQAAGEIQTRQEAEAFIENLLVEGKGQEGSYGSKVG